MKKIELVFRTIGERTSQLALTYARKHIGPANVHLIEHVTPPAESVQRMLAFDYDADFVVFMDADCLILEDMQPFLQANEHPFVDCYVMDKFRGWVHCGVHIKRIDVVNAMKQVDVPENDARYVLRSESRIHNLALLQLGFNKVYKGFRILHDFGQFYQHLFAKYLLREVRSREPEHQRKLDQCIDQWPDDDFDFFIARFAVNYARKILPHDYSVPELASLIADLSNIAQHEFRNQKIQEKPLLTPQEISNLHTLPFINVPEIEFDAPIA